jgi:hypothetical protein
MNLNAFEHETLRVSEDLNLELFNLVIGVDDRAVRWWKPEGCAGWLTG